MATVVNPSTNQVKLNNGQVVNASSGGWYDGQQYVNGSLSNPGQINPNSNQQGAGQAVSQQVVAQTNPNNVNYVNNARANAGLAPSPQATNPAPVPQEAVINPQGANYDQTNAAGGTAAGGASAAGGVGAGGAGLGGAGVGLGVAATPPINLPSIYQNLYNAAGISDLEKQLADKANAFNSASSEINDNPYLSESNRVGRVQKLQTDYNNDTKALEDKIATSKADIQTQLDLQTKQFDINSQSAQQAMSQFNSLLSSGALSGASGQDIANLTQATGLSSTMIQAAISAQTAKDQKTQVMSFDDGTNQGFVVINPDTGQIISKQTIGASKSVNGASLSPSEKATQNKTEATQQLPQDIKKGMTLGTAINFYSQFGLTSQEIYNAYAAVNYYNATAAQIKADKTKYNVK